MATRFTYPGVYLEEIESAVRPIVGVDTSVAAFVGLALEGPRTPTTINSWTEYDSTFGGLWTGSELSYAVYQFFLNGGAKAIVVRVGADTQYATIDLGDGVKLRATAPGTAGNTLTATVKHDPADSKHYTLTIKVSGKATETYEISIDAALRGRWLDRALETSRLVGPADGSAVDKRPPEGDKTVTAAADVTLNAADVIGDPVRRTGMQALLDVPIFNLLVIPPQLAPPASGTPDDRDARWAPVIDAAARLCVDRRAMLLLDPPFSWTTVANATSGAGAGLPVTGVAGRNAAVFYPRLTISDPAGGPDLTVGPIGTVAGVFARTDTLRGVWKAPAGVDAALAGVRSATVALTDAENGGLNPLGVNCLRTFPVYSHVLWGSRTCRGNDEVGDPWKYVPVRRLALFIEETLFRATKWVVFEPNDEPLWASIRLNVGAFMDGLFRQGAFQGRTAREAYFVKCDRENNPQADIDVGVVNVDVGFQPLKPAEFVRIRIQQKRPDA
ncbi:phage tail sheath C-terminal domain-containing protein [Nonomuraea sp. NPDC003709]|uniref:phage tail sheath family protein n=1 Tax=Nonomuraea sp. NPDC003709 TaxID=3154450 RepID=UPI0033B1A144